MHTADPTPALLPRTLSDLLGSRASVSIVIEKDHTMGHPYRAFRRTLLTGRLVVGLLITARTLPATANEVLTWNETALKAIEAGGQRSVQIPRALAMMQGAVHDALNTITPRYTAYYFEGPGDAGASPEAAVAAAAHTV
jgi:hypothetical protein